MTKDAPTPAPTLFGFGQRGPHLTWDEKINRVARNLGVAAVTTVLAAGLCVTIVLLLTWVADWAIT